MVDKEELGTVLVCCLRETHEASVLQKTPLIKFSYDHSVFLVISELPKRTCYF